MHVVKSEENHQVRCRRRATRRRPRACMASPRGARRPLLLVHAGQVVLPGRIQTPYERIGSISRTASPRRHWALLRHSAGPPTAPTGGHGSSSPLTPNSASPGRWPRTSDVSGSSPPSPAASPPPECGGGFAASARKPLAQRWHRNRPNRAQDGLPARRPSSGPRATTSERRPNTPTRSRSTKPDEDKRQAET